MNYRTPGVYIKEISKFPPSVAQVETAIPVFIGYTEKVGLRPDNNLTLKPTRITSLLEYTTLFGGANPETRIVATVTKTVNDSNEFISKTVVADFDSINGQSTNDFMYYAMQMFFANGGGPCYICSLGVYLPEPEPDADTGEITITTTPTTAYENALVAVAKVDEITLFAFPDLARAAVPSEAIKGALTQCAELQDRFVIIDSAVTTGTIDADIATFRNDAVGNDNLKYGAAYYPNLNTVLPFTYNDADIDVVKVVVGGTTPGFETPIKLNTLASTDVADITADNILYNEIKQKVKDLTVTLVPSSAIAGVYANVDTNKGVWKSPANISLKYVKGPSRLISNKEQGGMNISTTGKSVNAIRTFAGKGTLVWGARTLAGNDNEWRYVSVRRFFNMVEESVKKASERYVFENNDANTWLQVRVMIENFLTLQWRAGALQGAKPSQAFFVRIGLGETMTAQDILEGRMVVEIGMAVVRPAEFIILKFSHKLTES